MGLDEIGSIFLKIWPKMQWRCHHGALVVLANGSITSHSGLPVRGGCLTFLSLHLHLFGSDEDSVSIKSPLRLNKSPKVI